MIQTPERVFLCYIFYMTTILSLILSLFFIYVAFWALGAFDWRKIAQFAPQQSLILRLLIAIALGYLATSFFMAYFGWVSALPQVFWPVE